MCIGLGWRLVYRVEGGQVSTDSQEPPKNQPVAFCSLRWLLEPLTGLALQMTGTRSLDQSAKKPFGSDLSPATCQHTAGHDVSHTMSVLFTARLQAPRGKPTAQFSSSHWACLASDCPLQRGAFFPPLWVENSPRVSTLCLCTHPPTAVTSRGTPKGTCTPGAPRLPASPMGVAALSLAPP